MDKKDILRMVLKNLCKSILLTAAIVVIVLNIGYLFGEEMLNPLTNSQMTALIYISAAIAFSLWGIDIINQLSKK